MENACGMNGLMTEYQLEHEKRLVTVETKLDNVISSLKFATGALWAAAAAISATGITFIIWFIQKGG